MGFHKPFPEITLKVSPVITELVRRLAEKDKESGELETDLSWLGSLRALSTRTAFKYAEDGKEVFMIYPDGTDSLLEDIDEERSNYSDLSKSWPKIQTIFVIEEEL